MKDMNKEQDEIVHTIDQPAHDNLLSDLEDNTVIEPAAKFSDRVYDVPVTVSAVLGKIKLDVAKLLSLDDGSVIELDRKVGEPIDLYVNNKLIARGELVMNDGQLGVTMTEIVGDGQ